MIAEPRYRRPRSFTREPLPSCGPHAIRLRRVGHRIDQPRRVAERLRVQEFDDQGRRLVRITRSGIGSVVTQRRAQMVLLSAQRMPVPKIAEVSFSSAERVRDVTHNFNTDGSTRSTRRTPVAGRRRFPSRNGGRRGAGLSQSSKRQRDRSTPDLPLQRASKRVATQPVDRLCESRNH